MPDNDKIKGKKYIKKSREKLKSLHFKETNLIFCINNK